MKAGVYILHTELDKLKYKDEKRLKIGCSKNIKKRFKSADTFLSDGSHINYITHVIHSPLQSKSGVRFIEKNIHNFYVSNRIRNDREFFRFDKDFCIENEFKAIQDMFSIQLGIEDLTLYGNLKDVPITLNPYIERKEELKLPYPEPREHQNEHIQKIVEYYTQNLSEGGLYLPPGYGKTFISIFSVVKLNYKNVLILTPRLSICNEWEKCLDYFGFSYATYNSENDLTIGDCKSNIHFTISTYQTLIKHKELLSDPIDLMICDEAHCLMTDTESETPFASCIENNFKKLFLTATPTIFKQSKEDSDSYIPTKIKYQAISQVDLNDAVEQGFLCDYRILIHDKHSILDCTEHLTDLINIYDRKKIIVFYNTRKSAKEAYNIAKEKMNCFYVDGETSKEERIEIIEKFMASEIGIIFNIDVFSEGVSIDCTDCVLLMEPRGSQRAIIQILGRALRTYKDKECSILCIPSNCNVTLNESFNALYKEGRKLSDKIFTRCYSLKERKNLAINVERELNMVEIDRKGGMVNYKLGLLEKYIEENEGEGPFKNYIENGINLGGFYGCLKQKYKNQNEYKIKERLKDYSNVFKSILNWKHEMENKEKNEDVSRSQKLQLLEEYIDQNKKPPVESYEEKRIQLGRFYSKLKQKNKNKNETNIKEDFKDYPKLLQAFLDWKKEYDAKEKKQDIPIPEKLQLLEKYIEQNKNPPFESYENNKIKLGLFYGCIKQKYKNQDENNIKEKLKEFPRLLKALLVWKKEYDAKEKKEDIPIPEKLQLLEKHIEKNKKPPVQTHKENGVQLGRFYTYIKQKYKNKDENKIKEELENYPRVLETVLDWKKEYDRKEKKQDIPKSQKLQLLEKYIKKNKGKTPPQSYIENEIKLGLIYDMLKQKYKIQDKSNIKEDFKHFPVVLKAILDWKQEYDTKEKKKDVSMDEKLRSLEKYIKKNKNPPVQKYEEKAIKLGKFYTSIKQKYKNQCETNIKKDLKNFPRVLETVLDWKQEYDKRGKGYKERCF